MNILNYFRYCASKNLFRGVGLFVFTFLIFLSPLVPLVDVVVVLFPVFFYSLLAISGIIATSFKRIHYIPGVFVLVILILLSISGSPVKAIGAALSFYVAYTGVRISESFIFRSLFILLLINYLLILLQLSGIHEVLYSFTNYSNMAVPISFLESGSISPHFLPQFRPSGIFPSPTYISFFCITLSSISAFFRKKIDRRFMLLLGSFFVLTGSTLGLILILLLSMFAFRDKVFLWGLLGYVFTLFLYFVFVPDLATYNFSVVDFSASVLNRRMDESILTLNLILFAGIALVCLFLFWYASFRYGIRLHSSFPALVMIFFPLILHDSSSSLLSFFIFGLGIGIVGSLMARSSRFLR